MLGKQYYIRDKEFLCIVDTKESVNLKIEVTRIEHKEKKQKKEQSIREVQDSIKQSNAYSQ